MFFKRVSFNPISYIHSDENTITTATKINDGLSLRESIFEDFIVEYIKHRTPYDILIRKKKYKLFMFHIHMRLVELIESFNNMLQKYPSGTTIITKYRNNGSPYKELKYIHIPVLSGGGGKNYSLSIKHKKIIKYFEKSIKYHNYDF